MAKYLNESGLSKVFQLIKTNYAAKSDIPTNLNQLENGPGYITGVDWDDIENKPDNFAVADHTHATNEITALTGYTLGTAGAIAANDTLNTALGKLQASINGKQPAGNYLTTGGTAADSAKLGGIAAANYALLDSPAFTGTPTAPTATAGTNTTQVATTAFVKGEVDTAVSGLVNSAPAALDTLNELATALGNDPNFATTIATQLGNKVSTDSPNYIKSASASNHVLTLTKGDDTTVTFNDTIPIQSDWNESDPENLAYIQNRPFGPIADRISLSWLNAEFHGKNFKKFAEGTLYGLTDTGRTYPSEDGFILVSDQSSYYHSSRIEEFISVPDFSFDYPIIVTGRIDIMNGTEVVDTLEINQDLINDSWPVFLDYYDKNGEYAYNGHFNSVERIILDVTSEDFTNISPEDPDYDNYEIQISGFIQGTYLQTIDPSYLPSIDPSYLPSHAHIGTEVTLTGYSRPEDYSTIGETDTVNIAIGKLEAGLNTLAALLPVPLTETEVQTIWNGGTVSDGSGSGGNPAVTK